MLGHKIDLTISAQGVDSPEVFAAVASMKCDKLQGAHVGRAGSTGALKRQVAAWNQADAAAAPG